MKDTEKGSAMGKFANMPRKRLARGCECPKARLWEISWIAENGLNILRIKN